MAARRAGAYGLILLGLFPTLTVLTCDKKIMSATQNPLSMRFNGAIHSVWCQVYFLWPRHHPMFQTYGVEHLGI